MNHTWTFQRIGGLDQVVLANADDILNLSNLDPKLWVALSCPTTGLEFDERTLMLLDTDHDGRIRIPDIIEAINWISHQLTSLDMLFSASDRLPLSQINTSSAEGTKRLATAEYVLASLGKAGSHDLTQSDVQQAVTINAQKLYNGDAIFPPSDQLDQIMQTFIQTAIKIVGAIKDISGQDGINQAIASAFIHDLQTWHTWQQAIWQTKTIFGENVAKIGKLVHLLKPKIDDYFLRVNLAQYAPQAEIALNVNEKYIVSQGNGLLSDEALEQLPLSKIEPGKALNLVNGINPFWQDKIAQLRELILPILANRDELSQHEWQEIQRHLAPYVNVVNAKPNMTTVTVTTKPTATIDELPNDLITQLLDENLIDQFNQMVAKDNQIPIATTDVLALEKLVLFHKYLYRLLVNFVSFADFFSSDRSAIFQTGKLYIDSRCATLCVTVKDIAKHSVLANYSELCLLYCECTRHDQKQLIAAAITAGNGELLMEGRNGVFIDSEGNDWDATVVKMISKPISISEAVWAPYQRIGRLITAQITKWANNKDASIDSASSKAITTGDNKFDIGKSVGIFAAIGLAIGAIGTAFATLCQALFGLKWWQFPLVIVALFLIISGPSVILAWLKLRRRTLGPLLEASGWATNGHIKISLLLGKLLTSKAELPRNAKRNLVDPMHNSSNKIVISFLLIIIIAITSWLWFSGHLMEWLTPFS
ncbi:hypothetical protein PT273_04840 [Orbaceae bacterium ESL0727]|nr:hypothetical protein [Orbaceae bacterium ESL0727]